MRSFLFDYMATFFPSSCCPEWSLPRFFCYYRGKTGCRFHCKFITNIEYWDFYCFFIPFQSLSSLLFWQEETSCSLFSSILLMSFPLSLLLLLSLWPVSFFVTVPAKSKLVMLIDFLESLKYLKSWMLNWIFKAVASMFEVSWCLNLLIFQVSWSKHRLLQYILVLSFLWGTHAEKDKRLKMK